MNTPRTSVSFLAMSTIVALALGVLPQTAAAAPPPSDAPAAEPTPEPKATPKPKVRPKPKAKRSLDATAARALRSSSRKNDSGPRGERVAMRTAPAAADSDPPKRGKSKKKATKSDGDARAPGSDADRRISLDEDFLVEGKLEKPNAFFILRRSQSGYDWARLDAKFLPLVLESVQDPLF